MFVHHAIVDYVVRLVVATRNPAQHGMPDVAQWIAYGASPRASLGLIAAGRALALLRGRDYVLPQDVLDVATRRVAAPHGALLRRDRRRHSGDACGAPGAADRAAAAGRAAAALWRTAAAGVRAGPAGRSRARAASPPAGSAAHEEMRSGSAPALDLAPAEPLLRRLELTVRNKLDGLLQGNYLGLVPGPGSEAGDSRLYFPGDDVRRMDWPVTARTMVPHVRQTIADRELETWLVVDLSPSIDFGTALSEKRELVLAAITSVVYLTVRGGNRVGAIVSNGERTQRIPARGGTAHARHLMRPIAPTPRAAEGQRGDLAAMLEQLRRPPRRRGLVADRVRLPR